MFFYTDFFQKIFPDIVDELYVLRLTGMCVWGVVARVSADGRLPERPLPAVSQQHAARSRHLAAAVPARLDGPLRAHATRTSPAASPDQQTLPSSRLHGRVVISQIYFKINFNNFIQ